MRRTPTGNAHPTASSVEASPSSPGSRDVVPTAREPPRVIRPKQRQTQFKVESEGYPWWHNAMAGAGAGAGARLLTAPLDLLKIRRQLSSVPGAHASSSATNGGVGDMLTSLTHIVRTEGGVRSLFRGNLPATYLWVTYAAVQFSLYARMSDVLSSFAPCPPTRRAENDPAWAPVALDGMKDALARIVSTNVGKAFFAGATAGVGATLVTYPFDICRTAFASRGLVSPTSGGGSGAVPKTVTEFAKKMYRANGLRGFYAGVCPALVQIVPYMGLNFAFYDRFVRMSDRHNVGDSAVAGAVAGGLSKFLVYPMDTVKKKVQAQGLWGMMPPLPGSEGMVKYRGMVDCVITITQKEGLGAFYRGLVPTVIKSMTATGLTFAFYTMTKNALESVHDRVYYSDEFR